MRIWLNLRILVVLVALGACSKKTAPEAPEEDTGAAVTPDTTAPADGGVDTQRSKPDTQTLADTSPLDVSPADGGPVTADTSASDTQPKTEDTPAVEDTALEEDVSEDVSPPDAGSPDLPPEPVAVDVGEGKSVSISPPPPGPTPRPRRRMNLDQIQLSIVKLTGLSDWVSSSANLFEKYTSPLGRPDFESSVLEDLTPGLFFEKVLGDFTRYICPTLMEKEIAAPPQDRVFIIDAALTDTVATAPELIEKNLRTLLLRYHGRYIPAGSAQIEPWVTLFKAGANDGDATKPVKGWTLVCTALLSHPHFFSY